MDSKLVKIVMGVFIFTLSACSTGVKRGSVVMKINDDEAHVGIGKNEVAPGDHLQLFNNVCTGGGGGKERTGDRVCRKVPHGHGEVVQVINDDYSIVKFPPGTKFAEGDTLEKHAH